MLARTQLEVIARREGVPLHVVEWDYLQHLFLRHGGHGPLAFKGGTCLRIAYGSPRYSEDLDFNADGEMSEALDHVRAAARRLADYGIRAEVVRRPTREGLAAILRSEGPLYTGDPRSRAGIRLEVSLRHETVATEEVFVPRTPYADVPQLVLRVLTKDHLLAEKVRALLVRGKPRDLYDVHFLLVRGATAPRELLDLKMGLYRRRFTASGLEKGIASARPAWARDLGSLLGQVPPFEPIADEVRARLGVVRPGLGGRRPRRTR
ncbi:MAG TPA: nucleotidyl transferase AbiEii/AbiGii toxin family protein [Thermoplasmata archaeon]|nr:nucleotidyl transferase AbiEii/AbiGii toxin family protein [Thermoplasmata archaeon]